MAVAHGGCRGPVVPARRRAVGLGVTLLVGGGAFAVGRLAGWSVLALLAAAFGSLGVGLAGEPLVMETIAAGTTAVVARLNGRRRRGRVAEVRLLGPVSVTRADGEPVVAPVWRNAKNLDLLRLLALAGRPVGADEVARTLWPDADDRRARASLRTAVFEVRKAIGAQHLQRDGDELRLQDVWVDVDAYRSLAVRGRSAFADGRYDDCLDQVRQAEALHLSTVAARSTDSVTVAGWLRDVEDLRQDAVLDAADAALRLGRADDAVDLVRSCLGDDAAGERAHRVLMEAYEALGEIGLALQVFERCRRSLADELGVDPSPQTRAVHLRLLASSASAPSAGDHPETVPATDRATASVAALVLRAHGELGEGRSHVLHLLAVVDGAVPLAVLHAASAELAPEVAVDEVAAAVARLVDLGAVRQHGDGSLEVADPRLRTGVRCWLRPGRRDELAEVLGPLPRPAVAAPAPRRRGPDTLDATELYARARDALVRRSLGGSRHLATRAQAAAAAAGDPHLAARAASLALLPDAAMGAPGGWLRDELTDAVATYRSAVGDPPTPLLARLEALAALAGARGVTPDVDALMPADRWIAVRLLTKAGRFADALSLSATYPAYPDALLGPLMRLGTARLWLAMGDAGTCREHLGLVLRDGAPLIRPEATAMAAALAAADGDVAGAQALLAGYETALGDDGERPAERFWRLLAQAVVLARQGQDVAAAGLRARAVELALASGLLEFVALAAQVGAATPRAGDGAPAPASRRG